MVKNSSGLTQVFYHKERPYEVPPGFIFSPPGVEPRGKGFEDVKSAMEAIEASETIVFRCRPSLSDVLRFIPVAREIRGKLMRHRNFVLATQDSSYREEIVQILAEGVFDMLVEDIREWEEAAFVLDIFQDDSKGMHKVDEFRMFFGLPVGEAPEWSEEEEKGSGTYVVLNEGDSYTHVEPLSFDAMLGALQERYKVIPIRANEKLPPAKLVELLLEASCLITPDSAPLWIAHYTRTPVVTILNSRNQTDKETISYHPLYAEGAKSVMAGMTPPTSMADLLSVVEATRWTA